MVVFYVWCRWFKWKSIEKFYVMMIKEVNVIILWISSKMMWNEMDMKRYYKKTCVEFFCVSTGNAFYWKNETQPSNNSFTWKLKKNIIVTFTGYVTFEGLITDKQVNSIREMHSIARGIRCNRAIYFAFSNTHSLLSRVHEIQFSRHIHTHTHLHSYFII